MKTRSSRRPLAAVALLAAVLLSGSLARAEAATSASGRAGRQGRREAARGAAPAAIATVERWVAQLLADIGLAPTPTTSTTIDTTTQTTLSDNGAGIDPNG